MTEALSYYLKKESEPPHTRSLRDKMLRYRGEIDNALYKAEIACSNDDSGTACYCGCPFYDQVFHRDEPPEDACLLPKLREILGDHVEHHDIPQCDTEEK